jgi:hypothetical protein
VRWSGNQLCLDVFEFGVGTEGKLGEVVLQHSFNFSPFVVLFPSSAFYTSTYPSRCDLLEL